MNPQQEAVALFRFLESRGFKPSVRSIGRALREQGLSFRESTLRDWLSPFLGRVPDAIGTQAIKEGTQSGRNRDATSREKEVSLFSTELEPKGSSATPVSRTPAQKRLKLRTPAETVADDALKLLEPIVRPHAVSISWTAWKQRNRQTAVRMAETMTASEIADLYDRWRQANERDFGMLRWAVEWAQRGSKPRGASQGPPGTIPFVCDDGTVIYGNPNDPVPLSELVAG